MLATDFNIQQKEFLEFLKLLHDNDLLGEVVVAGSWVEYVYAQSKLLDGFDGNLKTLDVDFLIKNLRKPHPPRSILSLVSNAGYEIAHDIMHETTKIITPNRLEIEFLINQLGSGEHNVLKTNLGVNAQALRHLDIALRNTVTVQLLGMDVIVPKPEAYVIGKMVINHERKASKQEKDIKAIYRLAPHLNKEVFDDIYNNLSKKERQRIDDFMLQNGYLFEENGIVDNILQNATSASQNHKKKIVIPKTSHDEPDL